MAFQLQYTMPANRVPDNRNMVLGSASSSISERAERYICDAALVPSENLLALACCQIPDACSLVDGASDEGFTIWCKRRASYFTYVPAQHLIASSSLHVPQLDMIA